MMSLKNAKEGVEYTIKDITTNDEELKAFLLTLGCYSGENVTVIAHKGKNHVIAIKDGRYNIDGNLAEAILV